MSAPSEDQRKRADRHGRNWHKCGRCGRWFLVAGEFSSNAGRRVTVCGVLLDPPEAHCLLEDDCGYRWWPEDKPMPDLMEIDRHNRAAKLESIPPGVKVGD